MSRLRRLSSFPALATLRLRHSWMSWRQRLLERRLLRERKRLVLLQGLSLQQERLLVRLEKQLHPQLFLELQTLGVHPHLVENNLQGPKPPPEQIEVSLLHLLQRHPLSLTDRELTQAPAPMPMPEPEETQPPVQLELALRLGLLPPPT